MGAPGATEVRSLSKFGLSMITVVFEDGCRPTSPPARDRAAVRGARPHPGRPRADAGAGGDRLSARSISTSSRRRGPDGEEDPPRLGRAGPPPLREGRLEVNSWAVSPSSTTSSSIPAASTATAFPCTRSCSRGRQQRPPSAAGSSSTAPSASRCGGAASPPASLTSAASSSLGRGRAHPPRGRGRRRGGPPAPQRCRHPRREGRDGGRHGHHAQGGERQDVATRVKVRIAEIRRRCPRACRWRPSTTRARSSTARRTP